MPNLMSMFRNRNNDRAVQRGDLLFIYCPGCQQIHAIPVMDQRAYIKMVREKAIKLGYSNHEIDDDEYILIDVAHDNVRGVWGFNGDVQLPSLGIQDCVHAPSAAHKCHFYLYGGRIEYMESTSHKLSGRKVALPLVKDWPFNPFKRSRAKTVSAKGNGNAR